MNDNIKVRDRVFIRKEDRDIYQKLRMGAGDLKGVSNPKLFLIAMVLGYNEKGRLGLNEEIPILSDGLIRIISFSADEWNFIKAFSVYVEEDVNSITNINRMLDIAQIYAYYGIGILNKNYLKNRNIDFLEKLINDKFEKNEIF